MKTAKQILALLLALLLAGSLVSCKSPEVPSSDTPPATEATKETPTTPAPTEPDTTAEPETKPAEPEEDYSEKWRERPIPESFDLRSVDTDGDGEGDRCYVPPVRQQNPFGSCWGFAATAAAEISILGSLLKNDPEAYKTIDLSEKQMIYFSHMPLDDPTNPQNGEGIVPNDIHDAQSVYGTGGATFIAATTYAQGIGPSNELDPKYNEYFRYYGREKNTFQRYIMGEFRNYCYSDQDDWSIPEEYRFNRDYYLTESYLLPNPSGRVGLSPYSYHPEYNRYLKEQILEKRGVCIGFCADVSRPDQDLGEQGVFLNNLTWSHYTWDTSVIANHAVVLIGWDDNYPKENFLEGHQPPENGAWLVRNSWGSGEEEFPNAGEMNWGIQVQKKDENGEPVFDEQGNPVMVGSGYFWLSYFDKSLDHPESLVFSDSGFPEFVNQHDYLPVSDVQVKKSAKPVRMANVFTPNHGELLMGISCMTGTMNTEVSYEIYILCNDFERPDEGLLVATGSKQFEFGGYHKIDLPEPVVIQEGQSYSIILCMKGEDGSYIQNEAISQAFKETGLQTGIINPRESYLFTDGTWEDYQKIAEDEKQNNPIAQSGMVMLCCDNFPIKGYGATLAADMAMFFGVTNDKFIMAEGYNSTKVKLYFRGNSGMEMGTPEVTWTFLFGSEEIADIIPEKNASQIELTAKKAGTIYLAVDLDEPHAYGTAILKLEVKQAVPVRALTAFLSNPYTGEPITPPFMVSTKENIMLTEGVDYTIEYSDNIFCGEAKATVTAIVKDPDAPVPAPITGIFHIVPPKTEILEAEGSNHTLKLSLSDFFAIGATGYEIDYRKAGSVEWTTVRETNASQVSIDGLEGNTSYEVRVRSFVSGMNPHLMIPMDFFGEYSDVLTVEVK